MWRRNAHVNLTSPVDGRITQVTILSEIERTCKNSGKTFQIAKLANGVQFYCDLENTSGDAKDLEFSFNWGD